MVKPALIVLLLILGTAFPRAARAADAAVNRQGDSFEKFSLIVQRNIFDPNRKAGRRAEDTSATTPAADTIDLLGTLLDDGQSVAFTEGSNSENSRTLKPGDVIADMKVADISTAGLKLLAGDLTIEWPVGKRLVRPEGQPWSVADSPVIASAQKSSRTSRSVNRTGRGASVQQRNTSTTSNTNPADTLARLRERRRREMGQ